jgi:hypothetical protein
MMEVVVLMVALELPPRPASMHTALGQDLFRNAIEISAEANASGCYSPESLDRCGAMGEDRPRAHSIPTGLM